MRKGEVLLLQVVLGLVDDTARLLQVLNVPLNLLLHLLVLGFGVENVGRFDAGGGRSWRSSWDRHGSF
jgi:hypothetical protein